MTNALSSDGLEYGFAYDKNGNLTKTRITSRKPATEIESGKEYFIVNAYSGHAIDSCEINQVIKTTPYVRAAANANSARKLTVHHLRQGQSFSCTQAINPTPKDFSLSSRTTEALPFTRKPLISKCV